MKWASAAKLAALMFINYGLIAVSFRMLAASSYVGVGVTDGLIAWYGFTVVKSIAAADSLAEKVGYSLGGVCGSLLGLWLTVHGAALSERLLGMLR